MVRKIIIEILILWVCYSLYMAIIVDKRGPIGGIFFYPKAMQDRVIKLGLITPEELKRRRSLDHEKQTARQGGDDCQIVKRAERRA